MVLWHYMYWIAYPWQLFMTLAMYTMLVRLNLNRLLHDKVKNTRWGIAVFLALFILVCMTSYIMVPTHIILPILVWFAGFPIIAYLKEFRQMNSATKSGTTSLFGSYLFEGEASRGYMIYALLFVTSFSLGEAMSPSLSRLGLLLIPAAIYYLINKEVGRQPSQTEYWGIVIAMVAFWASQYNRNEWRIGLLATSALMVLAVSVVMYHYTRKTILCIINFIVIAFVLPLFIIGYNIYNVVDAERCHNYTDKYINKGVMFVNSSTGVGIRDRYGIVVPARYNEIRLIDWENHLVELEGFNGQRDTLDITEHP